MFENKTKRNLAAIKLYDNLGMAVKTFLVMQAPIP